MPDRPSRPFCMLVALLAEGVDRNSHHATREATTLVALLAEGVDRNFFHGAGVRHPTRSPSSRRAWIEMTSGVRRPTG